MAIRRMANSITDGSIKALSPRFCILGPLEARVGVRAVPLGSARQRRLLAALLLEAGRVVTLPRLIDALWEHNPPATAKAQVHTCVSALRQMLGAGAIVSVPGGYRLGPSEVDAAVFAEQIAQARRCEPAQAREHYRRALSLWSGAALADVEGAFAEAAAARLDEERLVATEELFEAELALGNAGEIIGALRELVIAHPLRERPHDQLMRALAATGRQAEAAEVYREFHRRLADEAGLEPGPGIQQRQLQILQANTAIAQLPRDLADFTGRSGEVKLAERALLHGPGLVAISGGGGLGKTSLAVHIGHRVAREFPDGQLFAHIRAASPAEVLARLLRSLGVDGQAMPGGLDERAAMYRGLLHDRRMLVVLDDATDEGQIAPLLPGDGGCAVLVTARRRLGGLPGAYHVDLEVLSEPEAVDLLHSIVGRLAPGDAQRLAALCGGLPLALRIAGARLISRPHWSAGRLADRLESGLLDELDQVRAALALSYVELGEPARRLFGLLGGLDARDVGAWAAAAVLGTDGRHAEDLLDELCDARLLDVTPGVYGARYRMHDLVHAFARAQGAVPDLERLCRALLGLVEQARATLSGHAPQRLPLSWYDDERAAIDATVRQAARAGLTAASRDLGKAVGMLATQRGVEDEWRATLGMLSRCLREAGDRHGHAVMLSEIGYMYVARAHHHHALAVFGRAMSIADSVGDRHLHARIASAISFVELQIGRLDSALRRCHRIRRTLEEHGDHETLGYIWRDIAWIRLQQGQAGLALRYSLRAVELKRAIGDRRTLPPTLWIAGEALLALGRLDEAWEVVTQARRLASTLDDVRGEAYLCCTLGRVAARRGDRAEAESLIRHALVVARRVREQPAIDAALAAAKILELAWQSTP